MTGRTVTNPTAPGPGQPPAGRVTLLFTDVEGSTKAWEKYQDAYDTAIQRHFEILGDAVQRNGGYVFKTVGDQVCAVFPGAANGVQAAVDAQRAMTAEPWPDPVGAVRVRMALHSGEPVARGGDYFGPPVNRVARLLNAAHPGQILVSVAVRQELPEAFRTRSLGIHMLKDLRNPEAIFQVTAEELPSDFPPPRTLDARPHNLPVQLTSFIGREAEIAELAERLEDPSTRLVTLLGPPGVGKTRLALQYAAEQAYRYPDGVWMVELARVRDPGSVTHQILTSLGLSHDDGRPAPERLVAALAQRKLLLVCDNFEHVLPASEVLSDLLRATRDVQVLVTSRALLRVWCETAMEVAPLEVPDQDGPGQAIGLEKCPATALFLDRAAAARPGWAPGEAEAGDVTALCRALDGLPLAIELAAARMRSMTLHEIRARLSDRFRLLSAGTADLPERQRTLRAALDWSYDLLTPEEQQALAQLSVFRGGFTLDAAEAVCDPATAGDAWETVPALHDRSFLVARERGGAMRYDMLEAVREYARERLGDGRDARQAAHAAWFLPLAEEAAAALDTEGDAAASERLDAEIENIRAAMDWSCGTGRAEVCARLIAATAEFFHRRGWWAEREERLFRALNLASGPLGNAPVVAWMEYHHANALADLGRLDEAVASAENSLARARTLGDARLEAWDLNLLGFLAERRDDPSGAEARYLESIALAERTGDHFSMASALTNRGRLADYAGDADLAEQLYERSLPLWRRVGSARGLSTTLANLGCLADEVRGREAEDAGSPAEAHARREEAIRLFGEALSLQIGLMNRPKIALLLNNIGEALTRDGRPEEALPLYTAAERLFRQAGSPKADYVAEQRARAGALGSGPIDAGAGQAAEPRDPIEVACEVARAIERNPES